MNWPGVIGYGVSSTTTHPLPTDDGVDVVVAVVCVVMGDRFRVCGKLDLVDLERGDTEGLADASVEGAGRWVRTVSSGHRFCIHYHVPHAGQS